MNYKKESNVKNLLADPITGYKYILLEKSDILFELRKGYSNKHNVTVLKFFVNALFDGQILSISKTYTDVYRFDNYEWQLVRQLAIDNFRFNNDFKRMYAEVLRNDKSYIKCFDTIEFNELFELEYIHLRICLLYYNNKIILRNRNGTELFFYEDAKLLFSTKIPLYEKEQYPGKQKTHQSFFLLTVYNGELICNVNSDRLISIDINTGRILWEIEDCIYQESPKKVNIGGIDMYGVWDSIIYVLQGFIFMEIDLKHHTAIVKKDFSNNPAGGNLWFHRSQLYKGKFYFTCDIGLENWKWNNLGLFDIESEKILWITNLDLPQGTILNEKPVVDEQNIYVRDDKGTLYIFENLIK